MSTTSTSPHPAKSALSALLVMSLRARRGVVAIAKPQDVHGLRFVVHTESDPQGTEVCLDCTDTEPQLPRGIKMAARLHTGTQDLELASRRQ